MKPQIIFDDNDIFPTGGKPLVIDDLSSDPFLVVEFMLRRSQQYGAKIEVPLAYAEAWWRTHGRHQLSVVNKAGKKQILHEATMRPNWKTFDRYVEHVNETDGSVQVGDGRTQGEAVKMALITVDGTWLGTDSPGEWP